MGRDTTMKVSASNGKSQEQMLADKTKIDAEREKRLDKQVAAMIASESLPEGYTLSKNEMYFMDLYQLVEQEEISELSKQTAARQKAGEAAVSHGRHRVGAVGTGKRDGFDT